MAGRPTNPLAAREIVSLRLARQHRALIRWAARETNHDESGYLRELALCTALEYVCQRAERARLQPAPWALVTAFVEAWRAASSRGVSAADFLSDPETTDAMLDVLGALEVN